MPFLAYQDGVPVTPVEVADESEVTCPDCEGAMYPRGGTNRVPIRHFAHHADGDLSCGDPSPGESDRHAYLKAIAASRLASQLPDSAVDVEVTIDIPPDGEVDQRRADAAAQLADWNPYWGNGLIIEVQYLNHSKDLLATTRDYLRAEYSVFWARPADFGAGDLSWETIQTAFDTANDATTSAAYAVYDFDPEEVSRNHVPYLVWDDPRPNCAHDWMTEGETHTGHESCPGCGINRVYYRNAGKFLYDTVGVLGPVASDPSHRLGPCPESDDGEHDWDDSIHGRGTWYCPNCRRVLVDFGDDTTILAADFPGDAPSLQANPYTCDHDWSYMHDPDREYRGRYCEHCYLEERLDEDDPHWTHRY